MSSHADDRDRLDQLARAAARAEPIYWKEIEGEMVLTARDATVTTRARTRARRRRA